MQIRRGEEKRRGTKREDELNRIEEKILEYFIIYASAWESRGFGRYLRERITGDPKVFFEEG